MQIKKIIVENEKGEEVEFNIAEGCGMFLTNDNKNLTLHTERDDIKMKLMKLILN